MKKIVGIVLFSQVLAFLPMSTSAITIGETGGSVELTEGMVKNPSTDLKFVARDPENPALPFPANPVYKNSDSEKFGTVIVDGKEHWGQLDFDLDPEVDATNGPDVHQEATDEKPLLYSWRAYLKDPQELNSGYNADWNQKTGLPHAGLVYTPISWDFGTGKVTRDRQVLQGKGFKSLYTDKISHLQMWDNRSTAEDIGWTVRAQLNDWPTAVDGSQQLVGAYIKIPKAEARNEFNTEVGSKTLASDKVDGKFMTKSGNVVPNNPVVLWSTKSVSELEKAGYTAEQIATRGKGMSTLTWNTEDVELHIPQGYKLHSGEYKIGVSWSLEKTPEA